MEEGCRPVIVIVVSQSTRVLTSLGNAGPGIEVKVKSFSLAPDLQYVSV